MGLKHLPLLLLLLAGCASSVRMPRGDDARSPAVTFEELLEEAVRRSAPGAMVFRDAGGLQIRIRGSLEEPLYVVDGVPLSPEALWDLNPYEIDDIEVLTDLARLARYGIRGGNGVVLISTKRP